MRQIPTYSHLALVCDAVPEIETRRAQPFGHNKTHRARGRRRARQVYSPQWHSTFLFQCCASPFILITWSLRCWCVVFCYCSARICLHLYYIYRYVGMAHHSCSSCNRRSERVPICNGESALLLLLLFGAVIDTNLKRNVCVCGFCYA